MSHNVLVLGHSFVRRLRDNVWNNDHPKIVPNLGLGNKGINVRYLGIGGGNIYTLLDDEENQVASALSEFPVKTVILQVGGNDICMPDFDERKFKASVRHFIFWLQEIYHVEKVIIGAIFPRFKPKYKIGERFIPMDPDLYDRIRQQINLDFYLEFYHHPSISYWRHDYGLMSNIKLFLGDGTHLNLRGTKKFFKSLRGALMSTL